MDSTPHPSIKPGDEYDPKTDEKVDLIERDVHRNLYEEKAILEELQREEDEIEERLSRLHKAKEQIEAPEH